MRTGEIDYLVRERLMKDLQCLAQPLRTLGERSPVQPDAGVLILDGSTAKPELQPARGDLVERGGHLGQHGRMPELIAQHHMSDLDALGAAEECGGQGPRLQRGILWRSRPVEVVVEPDRVDTQLLAAQGAMQYLLIGEAHLRQIDTDLGLAHACSSNLP